MQNHYDIEKVSNAKVFSPFLKCILEEIINRSAQQTAIAHKAITAVQKVHRFGQLRQIVDLAKHKEKVKTKYNALASLLFGRLVRSIFALRRHAAGRYKPFRAFPEI